MVNANYLHGFSSTRSITSSLKHSLKSQECWDFKKVSAGSNLEHILDYWAPLEMWHVVNIILAALISFIGHRLLDCLVPRCAATQAWLGAARWSWLGHGTTGDLAWPRTEERSLAATVFILSSAEAGHGTLLWYYYQVDQNCL